jgi:hypothetical protein
MDIVKKLLNAKSLLTMPTEGEKIESMQPFKIFSTLTFKKDIKPVKHREAAAIFPNQILKRNVFLCHNKPKNHLPSMNTVLRLVYLFSERT